MYAKEIDKFYQLQLIKIVLLFGIIAGAHGRLTRTPSDSVALKGNSNVFMCCSDIVEKSIFWKHKPVGSQSEVDIYDLSGLINGFWASGRFSVTPGSTPGCHRLITTNVSRGDEGTYSCTDNAGFGQWKGWELVMLESFDCQETNRKAEYMGVNDFGLPQDVISMVCISIYFGNMPPTPMCQWSSGTQLHDNYRYVTKTNLTTTLNIHMPARKEMNGDQLCCYARIEEESNTNQTPTTWNSTQFKINYALFHQEGASQCNGKELSLDCQPLCKCIKKHFNNGSSYYEIAYQTQIYQKLLQGNNLQESTFDQGLSGKEQIVLTGILAGFIGLVFGAVVGVLATCCRLKLLCPQQGTGTMEQGQRIEMGSCGATRHPTPSDGDNNTVKSKSTPDVSPSCVHKHTNSSKNNNESKSSEVIPMLKENEINFTK